MVHLFAVVEHVSQFSLEEQIVHVDADDKKYPLAHCVHDVPDVHVLQFAIDVEHDVQLLEPVVDHVPAEQAVQVDDPAAEYVFAEHFEHIFIKRDLFRCYCKSTGTC